MPVELDKESVARAKVYIAEANVIVEIMLLSWEKLKIIFVYGQVS